MKSPFAGMFGGGGGSIGNPGTGQQPSQQGNLHAQIAAAEDDDTESVEESEYAALSDLFGDPDEEGEGADDSNDDDADDDEDEEDDSKPDPKGKKPKKKGEDTAATNMAKEIQTALNAMNIGEDVIPEGFDPADPKQFRDVVGKIQRQTALATMQLAFKPMQLAISNLNKEMRTTIQNEIRNFGGNQQARTVLESVVPEINDPELKGLVNTLFTQAKKKTQKPSEAAASVRKALDAMGIKSKKGKGSTQDPSGSAYKEGKDALDLYGPLPTRKKA